MVVGRGRRVSPLACLALLSAAALAAPGPAPPPAMLDHALESLYRVLRFLTEHPKEVIPDTLLGVVVARGQLKALLQLIPKYPDRILFQPSRRTFVLLTAKILENMCEIIAKTPPSEPTPNSTESFLEAGVTDKLLQYDLWERNVSMRSGVLRRTAAYKGTPDPLRGAAADAWSLTPDQYRAVVLSGSPDEPQSDRCVSELLTRASCTPSQECREALTAGRPTGYATTHRLLFLQVARQTGCGKYPYFADVDNKIRDLCAAILKEAEFITERGISPLVEDLFMEQITLCGIEGFAEFVQPEWIQKILDVQRPEGCYGNVDKMKLGTDRRAKRSDMETEYGCMMHETGLAASALALSARALVEMHGL